MSRNKFPNGWDESKVRKVLAHSDKQSDGEALAEDEAGVASSESASCIRAISESTGASLR